MNTVKIPLIVDLGKDTFFTRHVFVVLCFFILQRGARARSVIVPVLTCGHWSMLEYLGLVCVDHWGFVSMAVSDVAPCGFDSWQNAFGFTSLLRIRMRLYQ